MPHAIFSKTIRTLLAQRAAYICTNPDCRCLTISLLDEDPPRVVYKGRVVHICAACEDGPRFDAGMNAKQRKAIDNAIFLCIKCANRIHRNKGAEYVAEVLRDWKDQHKKWVRAHLNR